MPLPTPSPIPAEGQSPAFAVGDRVRVLERAPVGHYRVPRYLRGKIARIERVIRPAGVSNEEEAYGRNAGQRRHYYRIAVPLAELWPAYAGPAHDGLRIEVYESWLERVG